MVFNSCNLRQHHFDCSWRETPPHAEKLYYMASALASQGAYLAVFNIPPSVYKHGQAPRTYAEGTWAREHITQWECVWYLSAGSSRFPAILHL